MWRGNFRKKNLKHLLNNELEEIQVMIMTYGSDKNEINNNMNVIYYRDARV